jgi:DNA-binding beta-propeller fold protein YncE
MNGGWARATVIAFVFASMSGAGAAPTLIPDGRAVDPAGFTIPVEGFASAEALSPDRKWLAVLAQDGGAIDVLSTATSALRARLALPSAGALAWTADGLFVSRGYTGTIARYSYDAAGSGSAPALSAGADLQIDAGLISGIAQDPATHRIAVARTANHEVVVLDNSTGRVLSRHRTAGEPFRVGFAGPAVVATLYDGDRVEAWRDDAAAPVDIVTGPHPTSLLVAGDTVFVANADGHDVVAIDAGRLTITRRFELAPEPDAPPGQTPAGMAVSDDGALLFVAESGLNDVAVVDLASGAVRGRIPTAWYPMDVAFVGAPTVGKKDARVRPQLWIANAQGLGSQPDPAGEWDGTYTGLVQHLVVEPQLLPGWSAQVARNDRLDLRPPARAAFPAIGHVVFIVRENKQFDEEFGDEPGVNGDPALTLFGRKYTPNAHVLAARYTLFDNFMSDGEASIYGHAWTTQAMANDYHERNAHARNEDSPDIDARVAWSIWPYPMRGEDTATQAEMDFDWFTDLAELPKGPRINVSGVFGPRGELIDALARKNVSFRVYGEQLTMQSDGRIAPGLAAHADRNYPGAHIDFGVLDTDRAKLFLDDVHAHGLAQYSYLTLPTDHTAGNKAGFYTPASYVASNDVALGEIVAGLSRRPEWRDTVIFVTCDDAQGTGDHVDSHRMPALAIGPFVRRGFVSHTRYSQTSILRTVELLFGIPPLNVYDAAATPITDVFARQAALAPYGVVASNIPLEKNPGKPNALSYELDGPDSAQLPDLEWTSIRGTLSLAQHRRYLLALGWDRAVAETDAGAWCRSCGNQPDSQARDSH